MFKYSPLRSLFFENYLVRATQRVALNDPFEILPSRAWLESAYLDHYKKKHTGSLQNLIAHITKLNLNKFGVISLASRNDNVLMWSHYGDEHKGMVIELDGENPLLKERFDVVYEQSLARDVVYRKNRINNFDRKSIFLPYIEKSLEWAYEEEKRIIVSNMHRCDIWMYVCNSEEDAELACSAKSFEGIVVNNCERNGRVIEFKKNDIVQPFDPNPFINCPKFMSMFRIPPEAIRSVTFGANSDTSSVQEICETIACKPELSHLKIFEAKLSDEIYGVEIVEKNA